jgi:hypothetical protein
LTALLQKERLTYVVKGTPGIGKTTMLFYLLWECVQKESPYKAVLFATNKDNFVARKTSAGCWAMEPFKRGSRVTGSGHGKAIGLVDVNPEGKVEEQGTVIMGFNTQAPCGEFGLHRLVVVSSAGAQLSQLIGKTGDRLAPEDVYHVYPQDLLDRKGDDMLFQNQSNITWNRLSMIIRLISRKSSAQLCFFSSKSCSPTEGSTGSAVSVFIGFLGNESLLPPTAATAIFNSSSCGSQGQFTSTSYGF